MLIDYRNIGGGSTGGGSTTGGDGAKKLVSGQEQSLLDANKALHVKTINGQSLAGQGNIVIEGGSGDYSIVTELPEAAKDGQMVYLSEDITHEEPVTGVGGTFMVFGETGETEYHIIRYGDADLSIQRNSEGTIYRATSRGREIPFSLNRTWYKLPKSFTNRKDAFYMFSEDSNAFWFYTYEGEDFYINTYGGQEYAAGEACDYVDIVVDYEKGQYITKNVESPLYSPKVTQGNIINNVTISFPDSYKSTFESEELMIGFEWYGEHPDLYIGANAEYVRYNVPGLDINMYAYNGESIDVELNNSNWVHIKYEKVGGMNTITFNCDSGTMIENPVSRQDDTFGVIQWVKYSFSAKFFVYDEGSISHNEIAEAVKPYFEALKKGGADAFNQLPQDYCILYRGIPFYGFYNEGDADQLMMYTYVTSYEGAAITNKKLCVYENGNCEWRGHWGGMHFKNPAFVSKEGVEGFDSATKITCTFSDGYEWGGELHTQRYLDGYDRDIALRPANYGEEYRLGLRVQGWIERDSIFLPDDPWDYGKKVYYNYGDFEIYWVAYWDADTRTATIYMRTNDGEPMEFVPDETLQREMDNSHIDITIEYGATLATVPSELSYKVWENDTLTEKKVILPTGSEPTFNLSINDEWTAIVNDDQLQGLINYIKENGANSVKDVDVKVLFTDDEGNTDVYIPVEIYASSEGINITISYGDGKIYINVDYDGNTNSFEDTPLVATNPNEYTVLNILQMSQDEYDALENKDELTLYIIKG